MNRPFEVLRRLVTATRRRASAVAGQPLFAVPAVDARGPHRVVVEAEKTETLSTDSQFEDAGLGHQRPANHAASIDSAATPPGRFARFLSSFEHPRALPAVVVLTVLITLPTLLIGFFADDYYFLAQIEHNVPASAHRSPLDLYRFASHSSEIETWFADPGRKMDFSDR